MRIIRMGRATPISILLGCLLATVAIAQPPKPKSIARSPHHDLSQRVAAAITRTGSPDALRREVDQALATAVIEAKDKGATDLSHLIVLSDALKRLPPHGGHPIVKDLLADPKKLARFFHALDRHDDVGKVLNVIQTLKAIDPSRYEKWFQFILAFGVVWDDYHGHAWAEKYMVGGGSMEQTYRHYIRYEKILLIDPGTLPVELAIFVVGTRFVEAEQKWVIGKYVRNRITARPTQIYSSIRWTNKISPKRGKGTDKPYTLKNILTLGGYCYEQAYYSENVYRLLGVPAVYTGGRGRRGEHAWFGVLRRAPYTHFDFRTGRYTSDRYYRGVIVDPTHANGKLLESDVKLLAYLYAMTKPQQVLDSYTYTDSARWVETQGKSLGWDNAKIDAVRLSLLEQSLGACPFNAQTWNAATEIAGAGRMSSPLAYAWAKRLFKYTAKKCPDFVVDRLPNFLESVTDTKAKFTLYAEAIRRFKQDRDDIVGHFKIWEGDEWLKRKNIAGAIESYSFPLGKNTKNGTLIQLAEDRIAKLPSVTKADALETAAAAIYRKYRNMRRRKAQQTAALTTSLQILIRLYESQNAPAKVEKAKAALAEVTKKKK
jgi:hypothetical protein